MQMISEELSFVSERGKCAVIHRKREVALVTATFAPSALQFIS
jgi:hypothetical protein